MAKIESTEIRQSLNVGLNAGAGPAPSGLAQAGGALAQSLQQFGTAAADVSGVLRIAEREQQIRENERVEGAARLSFNRAAADYLGGTSDTPGALSKKGGATKGMTEGVVNKFSELADIYSEGMNPYVREKFMQWAGQRGVDAGKNASRLERAGLELERTSNAAAQLDTLSQDWSVLDNEALLDEDRTENSVHDPDTGKLVRKSLREQVEDLILTHNPTLGDEAVQQQAEVFLAQTARTAVHGMLEQSGVQSVAAARELVRIWSDSWSPAELEATNEKIDFEFGTGHMERILADTMEAPGGAGLSAFDLSNESVKHFKQFYKDANGQAPTSWLS